ncbi:MAG: ACP S-malonyltransferase [Acidimicrobiales bacterium]
MLTFPGQGSQRPGMGRAWVDHPSFELVSDASDVAGRDLAHLLLTAEADELKRTRNAQLAVFVLSLVVLDAVERLGIAPTSCAGHSLGEYSALTATGALGFEDATSLVTERAEAMQEAADNRPGTMAAVIGIDDDDADAACRRAESEVWVANYNAPGQVVIAGSAEGVAAAAEVARELGAKKVVALPVGGAFHTEMMAPARHRLRKALMAVRFDDPEVPVIANVDATPHQSAASWPSLLSAQLCSPVRWRQVVTRSAASGESVFVEMGPGGVLTGLAKRCLAGSGALATQVSVPDDLDRLVQALAHRDRPISPADHGEHLYVSERLVLSPAAGIWQPVEATQSLGPAAAAAERTAAAKPSTGPGPASVPEPRLVRVGDQIGSAGAAEVRTSFPGALMGLLVLPGERVSAGQPVAWVRTGEEEQ